VLIENQLERTDEKPMTEEEWIKTRAIDVTPKDEEQSK
jgi:hypothetical protein